MEQKAVRKREPPGSPTKQGPHPLLVRCKAGNQGMLPEVPVLLHGERHRFLVCMTGGHQQHSAKGIPIRLIGVIGPLVVLRPWSVVRLVRLGNGG